MEVLVRTSPDEWTDSSTHTPTNSCTHIQRSDWTKKNNNNRKEENACC